MLLADEHQGCPIPQAGVEPSAIVESDPLFNYIRQFIDRFRIQELGMAFGLETAEERLDVRIIFCAGKRKR